MGKKGKERKRQRLENASSPSVALSPLPTTLAAPLLSLPVFTLLSSPSSSSTTELSILNSTIQVLDALSQNLNIFRRPELRLLRRTMQPLINEQRGKHFERKNFVALDENQLKRLLNKESIEKTSQFLQTLGNDLNLFRSKELKLLRQALHPLITEMIQPSNNNNNSTHPTTISTESHNARGSFSGRITSHFIAREWEDALQLLREMRLNGSTPKLGSLQRWIRDADLAPPHLRFPLIDAVLRVLEKTKSTPTTASAPHMTTSTTSDVLKVPTVTQPVYRQVFVVESCQVPPITIQQSESSVSIVPSGIQVKADNIRVVQTIQAGERPASTDLNIFALTPEGYFTLDSSPNRTLLTRVEQVPGVPEACVIVNALNESECDTFLKIANAMVFRPDTVVGINHVLWLADHTLISSLYARVKSYLPPTIDGCDIAGLNARLRFFCYEPGATYRVHIDGAWPVSGLGADGGLVDDLYGDRYSRLTFLIYLNDDFEGGHTTFFIPNTQQVSTHCTSSIINL